MNSGEIFKSEEGARTFVEGFGDEHTKTRLRQYARLLLEENQKQNLISKKSEEELWVRHFADSAQLLLHVGACEGLLNAGKPWLDLGTGPGLPGLIIAILRPKFRTILVESRNRRVEFLEHCVAELELGNCEIHGRRLELVEPFEAGVISARAFAPLEKLLRLSAPFSTKETRFLLPKGRSAAHELENAKKSIRTMFHVKHSLTDPHAGIIVSK